MTRVIWFVVVVILLAASATASPAKPLVTLVPLPLKPIPPDSICWAPDNGNDRMHPDPDSRAWHCVDKGSVELGLSEQYHWFWLRIKDDKPDMAIRFMMGLFDNASALIERDHQAVSVLNQGDSLPFAARHILAPELILPLGKPTGGVLDLFMRIRTTSSVFFTPEIGDSDTLVRRSMSDAMIAVLSSGFLLAVAFYGLVRSFGRATSTATWLSVLSIGAILWELSISGIGFMYLWPASPEFQTSSTFRGVAIWMGGYVLFVYEIMAFSRLNARFKQVVRCYAIFLFLIAALINELDPTAVGYILSMSAFVLPIPLFILGCISYAKGDKTLRWMLVGVVINDVATALVALSSTGLYQNSTARLLPIVTIPVMIAMFGMTMAARSAMLRKNRVRELESIVTDRTQSLKLSNEELQSALSQLDAIRNEESRLFRLATHDLRGPLNIISMRLLQLSFEKRTLDHDEIQEELAPLEASVEYLANILDETQASLRSIGNHDQARCVTAANLFDECQAIVLAYQPAAHRKATSLTFRGDSNVSMNVDKLRLVRILRNLIDNAIAHCPKGSRVLVQLWATPAANGNRSIEISVTDNGPGLPSDVENRVFGPETRMPEHALHGLGLFSARANASHIGASITYSRGPEGGSCFRLLLSEQLATESTTEVEEA